MRLTVTYNDGSFMVYEETCGVWTHQPFMADGSAFEECGVLDADIVAGSIQSALDYGYDVQVD